MGTCRVEAYPGLQECQWPFCKYLSSSRHDPLHYGLAASVLLDYCCYAPYPGRCLRRVYDGPALCTTAMRLGYSPRQAQLLVHLLHQGFQAQLWRQTCTNNFTRAMKLTLALEKSAEQSAPFSTVSYPTEHSPPASQRGKAAVLKSRLANASPRH